MKVKYFVDNDNNIVPVQLHNDGNVTSLSSKPICSGFSSNKLVDGKHQKDNNDLDIVIFNNSIPSELSSSTFRLYTLHELAKEIEG